VASVYWMVQGCHGSALMCATSCKCCIKDFLTQITAVFLSKFSKQAVQIQAYTFTVLLCCSKSTGPLASRRHASEVIACRVLVLFVASQAMQELLYDQVVRADCRG
jgi:hypothetical protein